MFISSVASCSNLWALVMDAGTSYLAQVFEISPLFLNKVTYFPSMWLRNRLLILLKKLLNSKFMCPFDVGMDYGTLG